MKVDGRRDRMPPREPKDLRDRPLRDERNDGDGLKQGVVIRGRGRGEEEEEDKAQAVELVLQVIDPQEILTINLEVVKPM